ncbi:MAG: hypothetical protein E6J20_19695 [Chloroflexi bacterium]|nr:MAG: hypothetical protein E6J20_19695 [Chloroflexota bacterium]
MGSKFQIAQSSLTIPYSAGLASAPAVLGTAFGWITGLLLDIELAKTDAGGPTTYQDWLYRSMTGISVMGGGKPYLTVSGPDLRALYWATRLRLRGRAKAPDMQAGAVTFRHQLPLLFGVNPLRVDDHTNFFDSTAAIAPDTDLRVQVTWAANTSIGANRTVGAGTLLRVTPVSFFPATSADEPKYYPQWVSSPFTPPQNIAGLAGNWPLAPGFFYRRSTVMILSGASPNDVRTDGIAANAVSEIGLRTADGRTPVNMKTWDFTQSSQYQFQVADDNSAVPGAALAAGASSIGIPSAPRLVRNSGDPPWS